MNSIDKINPCIAGPEGFTSEKRALWLLEFLEKYDLEEIMRKSKEIQAYRKRTPDWNRPVVMYGVRKMGHKCIKKKEIAVVIDLSPWQDRARTAETHWYHIVYKRPATDIEWEEMKSREPTRRYWIFHYFIEKRWTIDKIISQIVRDDLKEYGVQETDKIVNAFEKYFKHPIRIYKPEIIKQDLLFDM